jgi:hypothetical protein
MIEMPIMCELTACAQVALNTQNLGQKLLWPSLISENIWTFMRVYRKLAKTFIFLPNIQKNVLSLPVKTVFTTFEGKNTKTGFNILLSYLRHCW